MVPGPQVPPEVPLCGPYSTAQHRGLAFAHLLSPPTLPTHLGSGLVGSPWVAERLPEFGAAKRPFQEPSECIWPQDSCFQAQRPAPQNHTRGLLTCRGSPHNWLPDSQLRPPFSMFPEATSGPSFKSLKGRLHLPPSLCLVPNGSPSLLSEGNC